MGNYEKSKPPRERVKAGVGDADDKVIVILRNYQWVR